MRGLIILTMHLQIIVLTKVCKITPTIRTTGPDDVIGNPLTIIVY
jgi:hypothetical protein